MSEDAVVTKVVRVQDNTTACLPVAWQPKVTEVGTTFRLANNYSVEDCILENATYESSLKVKTLFQQSLQTAMHPKRLHSYFQPSHQTHKHSTVF
eukprot:2116381-Lingulodinium_polyedra.AAC.1